jgi:hypothetical protein
MPQMAFFSSADPYNQATTTKSIIGHFSKTSCFTSPALAGGYATGRECRTFSMPVARPPYGRGEPSAGKHFPQAKNQSFQSPAMSHASPY